MYNLLFEFSILSRLEASRCHHLTTSNEIRDLHIWLLLSLKGRNDSREYAQSLSDFTSEPTAIHYRIDVSLLRRDCADSENFAPITKSKVPSLQFRPRQQEILDLPSTSI